MRYEARFLRLCLPLLPRATRAVTLLLISRLITHAICRSAERAELLIFLFVAYYDDAAHAEMLVYAPLLRVTPCRYVSPSLRARNMRAQ